MNKFPYFVAGGVAGGILGWLIVDYLVYRMDEEKYDTFTDEHEEHEELVGGMDQELYEFDDEKGQQTNYGGVSRITGEKETLEKLARPYQEEHAPYIITAKEWEDPPNAAFERHTVLFYELDNVYCTEQEKLIDDPENMFVPNAHLHFGQESDDPDIVYINNPGRSEIYEILRMRASYSVDVLGQVPADPPKEKGSRKKRGSQAGSPKERAKKEVEDLGDVDNEFDDSSC